MEAFLLVSGLTWKYSYNNNEGARITCIVFFLQSLHCQLYKKTRAEVVRFLGNVSVARYDLIYNINSFPGI